MKGVHVGMKVEVVNCSMDVVDDTDVAFWVATVIEIKHYRVKLRYEGYEVNPAGDFWFDLRSKNIHPVGWCAKRNKLLIPPPGMITLHFALYTLTSACTLSEVKVVGKRECD